MADYSYTEILILSGYDEINEFSYWFSVKDESLTITSEIQADLKEFVENALCVLSEYNIPKLKCELLGYHLKNLYSVITS